MDTDQIDWLSEYVTGVESQLQADVVTAAGIDGYQRGERAGYLLGLRGTWRWMLVAAIVGATMGIAASLGFQSVRAEPTARPAATLGAPARAPPCNRSSTASSPSIQVSFFAWSRPQRIFAWRT